MVLERDSLFVVTDDNSFQHRQHTCANIHVYENRVHSEKGIFLPTPETKDSGQYANSCSSRVTRIDDIVEKINTSFSRQLT